MRNTFIIGTRSSRLALWQTEFVKASLSKFSPETQFEVREIKTTGDRILDTSLSKIGDKGLFTKEIENALLSGEIDIAVHSLKDLPTTQPEGLKIGAVTAREKANDVLISKNARSVAELPPNAIVSTGSLRRRSQLLYLRPDLRIIGIRGNVPTRIEKFIASDADAMILAFAGLHRLGLDEHIRQIIPTNEMIPAVGQGAVAVEIRQDDDAVPELVTALDDHATRVCVTAERAFLRSLEGGCQVPIGAFAELVGGELTLNGFVGSLDGKAVIRQSIVSAPNASEEAGIELAGICLERGAAAILDAARALAAEADTEVTL